MTLTETLTLPLARQVCSTYDFAYDKKGNQWTVNGHVVITAPEEKLTLDDKFTWTFDNRGLTSHLPKIRLHEQMKTWKLDTHAKATELFELLDMQFRNERGKVIAEVFEVYQTGDPTNF